MDFLLFMFMDTENKQPFKEEKLGRYRLERRFLIVGLFSGLFLFHRKPVSVSMPIKGIWGVLRGATSILWRLLKWKLPK